MSDQSPLTLVALEEDDLEILSSLTQDSLIAATDIDFDPGQGRVVLMLNRYRHEERRRFWKPKGHRIRAALQINTVQSVQTRGYDPSDSETVLSLLSLQLDADWALILTCSGGAALRLKVEAVDMLLTDIGDSYDAVRRPLHR